MVLPGPGPPLVALNSSTGLACLWKLFKPTGFPGCRPMETETCLVLSLQCLLSLSCFLGNLRMPSWCRTHLVRGPQSYASS